MRAGLTPRCVEPAAGATTRYCCVPVRLTVTREEKVRVFVVRGVAMVLHAPVPTRRWTASFLPVAFAPLTLPRRGEGDAAGDEGECCEDGPVRGTTVR